jgi:hypothetical protein
MNKEHSENSNRTLEERKTTYRNVRYGFWGLSVLAVILLVAGSAAGYIVLVLVFFIGIGSIFVPCPYCGKTAGFKKFRFGFVGNSFGGWCLHCGERLFLRNEEK